MRTHRVQYLLMGGQACVLYGAAEFSRDADLAILADEENLSRLRRTLDELQAHCIAVPPFDRKYLDMGLAVHFRCKRPDVMNTRIDVMSKMRGMAEFEVLWTRRTTLEIEEEAIELLSLPDLVQAKKTQRDKDWPMVTRLIEANYFQNRGYPTEKQVFFWLRELRTPSLLCEVVNRFPAESQQTIPERPLLSMAKAGDAEALENALKEEERREREADRLYWQPLRKELERLRQERRDCP
jgi:hypothetical protein